MYDAVSAQETVKGYRTIDALVLRHWTEGLVQANGMQHHYYRTGGTKPPVVLLHGFMESGLAWLRAARVLEHDYDLILVDARGHGGSDRIAVGARPGFSQPLLNDDVTGVIRALGLERPRLLGFSQGATTAIQVAAANPDLTHSVVAAGWSDQVQTNFTQSPGYTAWLSAYVTWLEQLKTLPHEERMLSALGQLPPGAPLLPEDEYVPWVEGCAQLDPDLVRQSASLWSQLPGSVADTVEALGKIACPVLVVKSEFFPQPGAPVALKHESSDRPNIKILRFENAGHLVHREQFEQFINIVQTFWKEHSP